MEETKRESNKSSSSYRSILKATSLFGGVQVYTILIQIVRSKFAAVLLGPAGMGIMGLLNSSVEMISAFTNCGLSSSAVRNIADASNTNDYNKVSLVIVVLRKLIWITGLLGAIICAMLSSKLSELAFGNSKYKLAFVILSINILLSQFTACQSTILQGLQRYKELAKCSVYGSSLGLIVTIPLYYFLKLDSIVPVLIISNLMSFILTYLFYKKVKTTKITLSYSIFKAESKDMLIMGLLISLGGLLGIVSAYLVKIFISRYGNVSDVGFYNAGVTIVESYVGLVFTAMAKDYYPRLSKIAGDNKLFNETINNQAELSIILLAPIIVIFVLLVKPLIIILYSSDFLRIEGLVYWAMVGIVIKALAWSLSYSILAQGNSKLFFNTEIVAILYGFLMNIVGYYFYGLTGLGISYLMKYVIYFAQLCFVTNHQLSVRLTKSTISLFLGSCLFIGLIMLTKSINNIFISYVLGIIVAIISLYFSYRELDKRICIKQIFERTK